MPVPLVDRGFGLSSEASKKKTFFPAAARAAGRGAAAGAAATGAAAVAEGVEVGHGVVVIAAITSCTNTSNPSVLLAAGLLAKKAVEKGLVAAPWVKTSLAPGSRVVTDYLEKAGLAPFLDRLGFQTVGYGCTTCIGNSGPLAGEISKALKDSGVVAAAVLSGNRNFEGRVHPTVKANYLASPPLVVAYAIAGTVDRDLTTEPLGTGKDGKPVFLKDVWPSRARGRRRARRADGADVRGALRERVRRQPAVERAREPRGRDVPVGRGEHVRAGAAVLRPASGRSPPRSPRSAGPAAWRRSATRSPPTTSARRATSPRTARRARG